MLFEAKLYTIESMVGTDDHISVSIMILRDHPVFDGHFPGNPILPGVCTLHIAGELLSKHLGRQYFLVNSDTIKFLNLVIPGENTVLNYDITYTPLDGQMLAVKFIVTSNGVEVLKMKGNYLWQKS